MQYCCRVSLNTPHEPVSHRDCFDAVCELFGAHRSMTESEPSWHRRRFFL